MGLGTLVTKVLGAGAKEVGLDKVLEIGTKWIPDKKGQMELEEKLLEVNEKIIKSNKSLLDKVIPVTFPFCVWILALYALVNLVLGVYTLLTGGTALALPFPEIISRLAVIFACGLVGKWNVKEFTKNKK